MRGQARTGVVTQQRTSGAAARSAAARPVSGLGRRVEPGHGRPAAAQQGSVRPGAHDVRGEPTERRLKARGGGQRSLRTQPASSGMPPGASTPRPERAAARRRTRGRRPRSRDRTGARRSPPRSAAPGSGSAVRRGPSAHCAPPRTKNGTSDPTCAATASSAPSSRPRPNSRFAPHSVAAASLDPPPRPACAGMRLAISTAHGDGPPDGPLERVERPPRQVLGAVEPGAAHGALVRPRERDRVAQPASATISERIGW